MSILISPRQAILFAGILILTCVWAAAATCPETNLVVRPSSVTIDNPGALTPGMTVAVSVRVDFPTTGNQTYPEIGHLELTTALEDPLWTWKIIRNGVKKTEYEERRSRVYISGDVLSWPDNTTESLEITMYGTAPSAPQMENRTILRIQDFTSTTCTNTPVYQYNAFVLNTTVTRQKINELQASLAQLRADTGMKNRTGIDTYGVMKKIEEAQQNLDVANATPPLQYASVAFAISNTETAIADGKRLLGEALAPGQPTATLMGERNGSTTTPSQTMATPLSLPAFVVFFACFGAVMMRRRGA